ncbi:MAG: hypothetical protein AB7G28_26465 [Pirellulales bacterium]
MKALTVCQPYAAALLGPKRIENRGWYCKHRGPLLIHAGKNKSFLGTLTPEELSTWPDYDPAQFKFGMLIGAVDVIDCVSIADYLGMGKQDPWAVGKFCIVTARPRRLVRPIRFTGCLGLFDVPEALVKGVEWQEVPT